MEEFPFSFLLFFFFLRFSYVNIISIYIICGEWRIDDSKGWVFIVDEVKRGRLLVLDLNVTWKKKDLNVTFDEFKTGFRTLLNELTIRYQIKIYTRRFDQHVGSHPVVLYNDPQVMSFFFFFSKKISHEFFYICIRDCCGSLI